MSEIEKKIEAIPAQAPGEKRARPQHEILEELVASVRGVEGRFAKLDDSISIRATAQSAGACGPSIR